MAKLSFIYGPMNSSKSMRSIGLRHSYFEKGKKAIIVKPTTDTRCGKYKHLEEGITTSRAILQGAPALFCDPDRFDELDIKGMNLDALIVDEAQFLSKKDVWTLSKVVDTLNIPVIAFGLKTTAEGDLFEGSAALLAMADELEEARGICKCGKRATHHVRVSGGKYLVGNAGCESEDVKYESVCRRCFMKFMKQQSVFRKN